MLTLPTTPVRRSGADVLELKQPDADLVIQQFKGITPRPPAEDDLPSVLPSSVQVRVLNGSGTPGQAADVATGLKALDFQVTGTGNADSSTYASSTIVYGPGQRDKALFLQAHVQGPAQIKPDSSLRGVDLVLITGKNFDGIDKPASRGGPTTTAPTAPTTTAQPEDVPRQPTC
jgi:hypothetical protein